MKKYTCPSVSSLNGILMKPLINASFIDQFIVWDIGTRYRKNVCVFPCESIISRT